MATRHWLNDSIWMQPHPGVSSAALRELVENAMVSATPRLGDRMEGQPKGYAVGARVLLKVFNEGGIPITERAVTVTGLTVRQLGKLTRRDLVGCGPPCHTWRDVQRILGFFERRTIRSNERVTIVRFAYHRRGTTHGTAKP